MGRRASSDLLAGMGILHHLFWTAQAPPPQLSASRHRSICVYKSKVARAKELNVSQRRTTLLVHCRLCSSAWLRSLPESYTKPLLYMVAPSPPNM